MEPKFKIGDKVKYNDKIMEVVEVPFVPFDKRIIYLCRWETGEISDYPEDSLTIFKEDLPTKNTIS